MKESIELESIKVLPKYFDDLEKIKKLNTQEMYKLYNELRTTTDEVKKLSLKDKLDKITIENIFLEKICSVFDGNYLSTYFKLHDLIINYNIALKTSIDEIGHYVSYLNPKAVDIKELTQIGERLNNIKNDYYLKGKFLKLLLTPRSRATNDEYYEKKFAHITSQLRMMENELFFTD